MTRTPAFLLLVLGLGVAFAVCHSGCRKPRRPAAPAAQQGQKTPTGPVPEEPRSQTGLVLFEAGNKLQAWSPATGQTTTVRDQAARIQESVISPDGRALLFSDDDTDIWLVDLANDVYAQVAEAGKDKSWSVSLAWSHDSQRFAYTSGGKLYVAERQTPEQKRLLAGEAEVNGVCWSPDDTQIAFGRRTPRTYQGQGLFAVKVASGQKRQVAPGSQDVFNEGGPAWSPDGKWIAFEHSWEGGAINLVRPDGRQYRKGVHGGMRAQWLPDSSGVVFADMGEGYADGVWHYRVADDQAERLAGENQMATVAVPRTGQLVAIGLEATGSETRAWSFSVHDLATGEDRPVGQVECVNAEGPLWSWDDKQFAVVTFGPDPELPDAPASRGTLRAFASAGGEWSTRQPVCERLLGWVDETVVKNRGQANEHRAINR